MARRTKCRFEHLPETDIALTSYGGAPATLRSGTRLVSNPSLLPMLG
jgi:hypothetical protein